MHDFRAIPIPSESDPPRSEAMQFLWDTLETLLISVILFLSINAVSARIRVEGYSMMPTLENGEFLVISRLSYRFGSPQRGDIIVFHYPRNPTEEYIKRVIGLPGDRVRVHNGVVYVNDYPLEEPYIAAPPAYETEMQVPEGTLFVLGDNRNNSSDSHSWGTVPLDYVVGKAVFVYWPLTRFGPVQQEGTARAAPSP
ncbi:MAG: signal peptidase I [Anaerolineae bacterium]|nr:MAG: signal peptidase I [Anaerolineae bacterium]